MLRDPKPLSAGLSAPPPEVANLFRDRYNIGLVAGAKRQHFLPQFLLRGFTEPSTGRVHLFRRGAEPVPVAVANVGAEGYFYGVAGPGTLDERVGREESEYALLVDKLRAGTSPAEDSVLIARFVAHLTVRTQHARRALTELGEKVATVFGEEFTREEQARAMTAEVFEKRLDPAVAAIYRAKPASERERIFEEVLAQGRALFREVTKRAAVSAKDMVRDKQLDVLARGIGDAGRTKHLETLTWSIVNAPGGTFILGDVGPIAQEAAGGDFGAPINMPRPVRFVLPLSDRCALVGYTADGDSVLVPEELNRAAAELSREFLVASQSTERERSLAGLLGTRVALVSEEELRRVARDAP